MPSQPSAQACAYHRSHGCPKCRWAQLVVADRFGGTEGGNTDVAHYQMITDTASMEGDKHKAQVAALPVKGMPGAYRVLLVTSRNTQRWIVPKGWPMKGRKDCDAAAQEALEEAGVAGRIHKHPMGAYTYEKCSEANEAQLVRVMVYMLEVEHERSDWLEKGQRQRQWLSTRTAASRVGEPGLAEIIKRLDVAALDATT